MSIGVTKIKIPIKKDELTLESVEPYLGYVLDTFRQNASKIRKDYDEYLGKIGRAHV